MRLIDADELKIDFGFTWDDIAPTREEMFEIIDRQPTAEPDKDHWKPRKHYVSPLHESFVEDYECSNCHFQYGELEWNYCPICGARMRGEKHG